MKLMKQWELDKRWSDKFLPEIKQLLGLHLIGEPPQEEDAERNTDLIVLKMEPLRIACRIRRNSYYQNLNYRNEITIREGRPSGVKTELAKIIEGWGDYFFYGFSCPLEKNLVLWRLCDLKIFRLWFMQQLAKNKTIPGMSRQNKDGSSSLRVFNVETIPGFVFARLYP